LPSRDQRDTRPGGFAVLLGKEWRDLTAGQAFWVVLLPVSFLAGYSFIQAANLYAESSKPASQLPELASALSPLDGIFVPTFGALYIANTFLFPFVAIRAIGTEKQTASLKLLLQIPSPFSNVILAKVATLGLAWLLLSIPCLSAIFLWRFSGGHVAGAELGNLLLGHFLYGAVITGIALIAAALADSNATAAILTLAATLLFWVLDFAAAGEGGLLKTLSGFSLTTLLRGFEQGVFTSTAVIDALLALTALVVTAGVWLNLRIAPAHKLAATALVMTIASALGAAVSFVPFYADASEDHRNSFAAADAATLRRLSQPLSIVVNLAPEDPRYIDFERKVLSKLRRTVPSLSVELRSESRFGLYEGSSEHYGTVLYRYGGRQAESRSTGAGEVLPLIYDLANVERIAVPDQAPFSGYPHQADTTAAAIWFYAVLPTLILIGWIISHVDVRSWRSLVSLRSQGSGIGDGRRHQGDA
jgi:ABC-2 type transport system permease protein